MKILNRCSIYFTEKHLTDVIKINSLFGKNHSFIFFRLFVSKSLKLVLVALCLCLSFEGKSQSFEISSDVCDSLAPSSYFMHVSGYATFTDSIRMTVELMTADSLHTIVYSASKEFDSVGVSTLTNFIYDPSSEDFSLDIGNYSTRDYQIRIISWISGKIEEEIIIDTF